MKTPGSGAGPRRFNFTLAHEVSHFLLDEQERRKRLGLPHTALNDIANEWLLEHAKTLGYKPPGESS